MVVLPNGFELLRRMHTTPQQEIEHYLRTGEHDYLFLAWPGSNLIARARHGDTGLRRALIATVRSRTKHQSVPTALVDVDMAAYTRVKVAPMVRGLFPKSEQQIVLDVLQRSVVFLTPTNIEAVLGEARWLSTAWKLANLYLASFGAALLSEGAPRIVGLSEETTCYVSARYFDEDNRFSDFVVHEAAHVFHNCKRQMVGLRGTRTREWLLQIDFGKRETFAYACEAYSRLLELGNSQATRTTLLSELEQGPLPADERVDAGEYLDILHESIAARNGWKRILERCTPPRQTRHGERAAA
jgi:hypothetical protein